MFLIRINIVDYHNLSELDMKITEYVNSNLEEIMRVLLNFLEMDKTFSLEGFFPRDYLMRKPQECRKAVDELYEIVCSKNIRDFIMPKYEYLLYAVLQWWDDCTDDEKDLIINPIDSELVQNLKDENRECELHQIQDFQEYYDICFQDHDFLPDQLSNMVTLYLEEPKSLALFLQHDNLDNYIDLMECDLRERYLKMREKKNNETEFSSAEKIIIELIVVLKRFQKRIIDFEDKREVEITADIHDAITGVLNNKYELQISREFTMGRARKKLGETDLYFYSEKDGITTDYAILENKNIENFEQQYLQLMGYLNNNFKFGITLSLNRKRSLKDGLDKIEKILNEIDGDFAPQSIKRIEILDTEIIVSEHIVPETKKRMKVYHLIFQLYDKERKESAMLARKK